MSLLVRLKNKLQDPTLNETKLREFDECMSLLKNENVELHKRIDQLEALYKTNLNTQQTHYLEEHIRELQQENGRLFAENKCQRQEYEHFLDQLTTMVIRTAVMQENIRKECALIYHVIERLPHLRTNSVQISYPCDLMREARQTILNDSSELIRSSSSNSSLTTHCSVSTSNSWTLDLSLENEDTKPQFSISNIPTEEKQQVLQRSETFIISKIPREELLPSLPMTMNDHNIQQQSTSTPLRPSRLSSCCSNSKIQTSNNVNNNRSSLTQKVSKLPIRTGTSFNRQQIPTKKSNIPTPVVAKTKKDSTVTSNRSIPSFNNSTIKKPIRPTPPPPSSSFIQPPSNKTRSCSITTSEKTNIPSPLNKCPRPTIETVKYNDPIEQIKSTSSESSIEEQQQHMNKLLSIIQDEGYSTWSSIDVKDDVIKNNIEKNQIDDRQNNIRLVKTWLDTSNRQCSKKPVKEVESDKLEEFTQKFSDNSSFLCPFVRNRCSNVISIPLPSTTTTSFSKKDISLDSLDGSPSNEQTITSSSSSSSSSTSSPTFSRSETFENLLTTQTLSNITDDLTDSTNSSSSTFDISEYIEDHFIDQDDKSSSSSSENSSSFETTIGNKYISLKPQKRLLFPGLLNRLIFFRRILSDSDLQRKEFFINQNENQSYVYHSNIINEHSVEVNLINTYGSDSELHVWSHDCAEQRRFLNERQQQQQQLSYQIEEENKPNSNQQLAVERQILLQQIYEYPWLLQENDLDRTNIQQPLVSPTSDLIVPSHNPDFYQLCALTNSSSFVISYDHPNARHTPPPTTSSVL